MAKINIHGLKDNSDDPTFRYKMEKLIVTEQKGKTVVTNIPHVAKDINRNPETIIKYFKKKFGVAMTYKDNLLITSKKISRPEFEQKLFEFIEYNVLCPRCKNPETKINDSKISCAACSFIGPLA